MVFKRGHKLWDHPNCEKNWFRKGNIPWHKGLTIKTDKRLSQYWLGKKRSKETREKISKTLKKNPLRYWLGKKRPDFAKLNKDPIFIEKKIKSLIQKPNKLELRLINLIKEHSLPFKYVGDGQFALDGRCPDFLNCNGGKQVIEVFGRYWHDTHVNNKVRLNRTYDETIKHYKKYGFECLVLWDDKLKNMVDDEIVAQIKEFMGGEVM